MGCHTWFYKPSTKSTVEIKSIAINNIEEHILYYSNESNRVKINKLCRDQWSKHEWDKCLAFYKRWLRRIQLDIPLWNVAIYYYLFHKDTYYKNGIFYEYTNLLHDVFCVDDYPDDKLTSIQETLNFIKSRHILLDSNQLDILKEFFNTEPKGGLIRFV